MLGLICVAIAVLAWILRASAGKGPLRLGGGELNRLRTLSDKLHRDEVHRFE